MGAGPQGGQAQGLATPPLGVDAGTRPCMPPLCFAHNQFARNNNRIVTRRAQQWDRATRGTRHARAVSPPAVTPPPAMAVIPRHTLWLMDTGSGHDLLPRDMFPARIPDQVRIPTVTLRTAGGRVTVEPSVPVHVEQLGECATPLLLESTPTLMSSFSSHGFHYLWLN